MALTDTAIRNAKPSGKSVKLSDGEGAALDHAERIEARAPSLSARRQAAEAFDRRLSSH